MKATITTNWITKEVELTQEQYDALFPKKIGRWKPDDGEEYWYLAWLVDCANFGPGHWWDQLRVELGNCYQTEKLAQKAFDRQLAIVRVNDEIDKLNDGWEMVWNWKNVGTGICYWYGPNKFSTEFFRNTSHFSVIKYCVTERVAEQIMKEMEAELKLIFNIK